MFLFFLSLFETFLLKIIIISYFFLFQWHIYLEIFCNLEKIIAALAPPGDYGLFSQDHVVRYDLDRHLESYGIVDMV